MESTNKRIEEMAWVEYMCAADHLAARGLSGAIGDPLPLNMMAESVALINDDIEAFQAEVRRASYARAMFSIGEFEA